MLILLINCFAGTRIYSKALSGYNSIKQHVSIETAVTYLYTVRLDEMGKNNIKIGWIPTRDMAFSSKGKAARFRQIQGRGPGGHSSPLFLDQLRPEGWKKNFFKTTPHPPLPLSEGLDLPVVCMEKCTYPFLGRASILNFDYSVKYNGCVTNCVVLKFPFGYYSYYNHMIQNLQLKLLPTLLETEVFRKKALNVINCNSFTISFNTVLYCRIIC